MPRGVKTDSQMIANIMASYALTNSYNATAKELGISDSTVKKIIMENQEEFGKVQEQKKEEFSSKASKIVDKALELLDRRFDKALNSEEKLEELIDIVMYEDDPDAEEKLTYKQKLDIAKKLSRIELNSLSEITTSMGTLYDKMRLANGQSTNNVSVSYEEALKSVSDEDDY